MARGFSPAGAGLTILFLAVFFWYHWPALSLYFSQDDFPLLAGSRPGWVSPRHFFQMGSEREYRPMTQRFYFHFNQLLFDLDPRGHHLMNILVHLGNTLLVGRLAALWVAPWVFLPAAFFFALHPVHFHEVFWISGISQAGYVFFLLLAILALVEYGRERGRPWFYYLALAAAAAAFLSKEDAVTLPAILSFTALLGLPGRSLRTRLAATLPFWTLLLVYLLVRVVILGFGLPQDEIYRPQFGLWLTAAKLHDYGWALLLHPLWGAALAAAGLLVLRQPRHRTVSDAGLLLQGGFFVCLAVLSFAPTLAVASSSAHYLSFASAALAWTVVLLLNALPAGRQRLWAALASAALFLVLALQQRQESLSNPALDVPVPRKAQICEQWMYELRKKPAPAPGCTVQLQVDAPLDPWESAWIAYLPWLAWDRPGLPVQVRLASAVPSPLPPGCVVSIQLSLK